MKVPGSSQPYAVLHCPPEMEIDVWQPPWHPPQCTWWSIPRLALFEQSGADTPAVTTGGLLPAVPELLT